MTAELPSPGPGLWRSPPFVKLWAGQTVSSLGSTISREALPLLAVLVLGASPLQLGILAAAGSAAALLAGLPAGVLIDRHRRRPLMIATDLARFGLLLLIPVAALVGHLTLPLLLIVAFTVGGLTFLFDVAYPSYVPTLVGQDRLVEANSKLEVGDSLAEIGGAASGGVLVQALGAPLAILADAVTFLVSAVSLLLIRNPEPKPSPLGERSGLWSEAKVGWRLIGTDRRLRALAAALATSSFFGSFFGALYVLFALRDLSLPPAILGLLIAGGGVGALIGAVLTPALTIKLGLGRLLILSWALHAFTGLLVPLAPAIAPWSVLFLLAAQAIGDFGWMAYAISELSLRQGITPGGSLGRVNAGFELLALMITPLGLLVAGGLAQAVGVRLALGLGAAGSILGLAWLLPSPLRGLREIPSPQPEAAGTDQPEQAGG